MDNKKQQERPIIRPMGRGGGPMSMMRTRMLAEKPKNAGKTVRRLLVYIGRSKYLLFSLLFIMLVITLLSLAGPALQGRAIDCLTLSEERSEVDFKRLIITLTTMGVIYLVSSGFSYMQGNIAAQLSQTTVKTMRKDLFKKLGSLPIKFFDTHSHGDIMSRMTNDVDNVSSSISQSISSLFSSVLTVIGSLTIMLYYSPLLTLVSFITLPMSTILVTKLASFMRKFFFRQQSLLGSLNGHVEEMVSGYRTVVAFSREKQVIKEFEEISTELKKTGIFAQIFGSIIFPLMNVIGNIGLLLIAGFGGYFALKGDITIGVIQAFLLYSRQFTRPINEIAHQYAQIQTAIAGAERVFEIMDTRSEVDEGTAPFLHNKVDGNITFENVDFSYIQGEPVLMNFSLEIKSGQKIAIVGATGAGKTTLVNLMTRFYDVDNGKITIDGINIKDIPKKELRKSIAIVLQDTILFSDTISSNLRYGNLEASDISMRKAAETSNADIFIERMPDGYETELSEGGNNLSQGQKQLISIARAILADPKILILDEATSSVDTRTELHIQEAMIALMKNRTSLIIAHRLSTIRDADFIIVIKNGRVDESGNHKELLKRRGSYFELYQNQFAGIQT